MRSVRLSKAIARGCVYVRNGKTGQVRLKFRTPGSKDRIFSTYPIHEQTSKNSYTNLSAMYSAEQLKASNLESLLLQEDLELGDFYE